MLMSNILINSLVDFYLASSDQYFSYIEMAELGLPLGENSCCSGNAEFK
jgi:hypothetical protein